MNIDETVKELRWLSDMNGAVMRRKVTRNELL